MVELPKGMSLPLRKDEEVKKHSGKGFGSSKMEMPNVNAEGVLVLTNHRVMFGRTTGLFSKNTEVLFNADHSSIQSVRSQGLISKSLIIDYVSGSAGTTKSVTFNNIGNVAEWQQDIQRHIMDM